MIVCRECGHQNDDDAQFCASCGEFLDWKREPAAEADAEVEAAEPVEAAVAAEPAPAVASVSGEPEPAAAAPLAAAAVVPDTSTDGDGATGDDDGAPRSGPVAIVPGEEAVRRPPKPPPVVAEDLEPGQLICDQCGSPNRAEARFCRRCGASLVNAAVVPTPSWWRRLLASRRRTYAAGERRSRRRVGSDAKATVGAVRSTTSRVMRSLALLSILGVGVGGALAWRSGLGERAGDLYGGIRLALFPDYVRVIPERANASTRVPGHPARMAFDGVKNTFWAEDAPGNGRGQKLVAHFSREVDLARVGITLGDQTAPDRFVRHPVPHRLRIRYWARGNRLVAGKVVFLAQKPEFQRFSLSGKDVVRAVAMIVTAFPAQGNNHQAAIAELEYFEKK